MNIQSLMLKSRFVTSELVETIECLSLCVIAIAIPLLFQQPQLLVGSLVNWTLIMAAVHLRGWHRILPLVMLPSIAAVTGGFLFGASTIYLLIFMPFIWIGNLTLVFIMKLLYVDQSRYFAVALPIAAAAKAGILFCIALLFVTLQLVPPMFLMAMGITQFITAVLGGVFTAPFNIYGSYRMKSSLR